MLTRPRRLICGVSLLTVVAVSAGCGESRPPSAPSRRPPAITRISPNTGSPDAATTVTISGSGFDLAATVTIGGAVASVTSRTRRHDIGQDPVGSGGDGSDQHRPVPGHEVGRHETVVGQA